MEQNICSFHATTILAVRTKNQLAIGGDGQISQGNNIIKQNVKKVRFIKDNILAGFAGVTSDALLIFDHLENYLLHYPELKKACIELVRTWRTNNINKLEAQFIVADEENMLLLTGTGDLLEPDDGVLSVGSGSTMAIAAARALLNNTSLTAKEIVQKSLLIVSELCVFTNSNLTILSKDYINV